MKSSRATTESRECASETPEGQTSRQQNDQELAKTLAGCESEAREPGEYQNVANVAIGGGQPNLNRLLRIFEGSDLVLERGGGNSKLGGRPRRSGYTAPAFGQRGLDNVRSSLRLGAFARCARCAASRRALRPLFRCAQDPLPAPASVRAPESAARSTTLLSSRTLPGQS